MLIAVTLIALGRVGAAPFWRAWRARAGWALALAGSLALLGIVTQLDGLGGHLARAGHDVSVASVPTCWRPRREAKCSLRFDWRWLPAWACGTAPSPLRFRPQRVAIALRLPSCPG